MHEVRDQDRVDAEGMGMVEVAVTWVGACVHYHLLACIQLD